MNESTLGMNYRMFFKPKVIYHLKGDCISMRINKRIFALLLACLFCVFAFAGCSGDTGSTPADTTVADTTTPPEYEKWPEIEGTVIYVDSTAEEGGDGTKDAPLRSIPEAQVKIREIKSSDGLPEGGITVLIASGEYKVTSTMNFTEEDSGAAESPIRYMSAEKNGAVFNGGIKIPASDFSPLDDEEKALINDEAAKDKVVKINLNDYGIAAGSIGDVFIGDERLIPSRYPNITEEDPFLRTATGDKETTFDIFAAFEFEEQALAIKERGKNWDLDKLCAGGYFGNSWCFELKTVESFDVDLLKVTLASKPTYGIGTLEKFYFYNIFAETDEFGEYYLDSDSMTLYVCPPDDFEDGFVEISLLKNYMISGDKLSYITFDGIDFTLSKGNGIVLSGNNITIENCKLSKIKNDAICISGSDITIQNNEIYQVGAHAVAVSGGVFETLTPANILVHNNLIYKWAQVERTYKCAVYMRGCGITVSHNEMYDAPHEAIDYTGPNNIIEYNEIYNVCMETNDCGAIYSMRSFDQYGTVLRYNLIHDIGGPGSGSMGVYWDDGLSGQTMYGNIIVNTTANGMNIGGGRDNVIENNLFINWPPNGDEYAIYYDGRARSYADRPGSGQEQQTVEMADRLAELQKQQEWLDAFPGYGDIIPYTYDYAGDRNDPMLSCNATNAIVRNNVAVKVKNTDTQVYRGMGIVTEYLGIWENNMEFIDADHVMIPGFENGDYTIAEDSEVFANGFERIPLEEIGRIGE